MQRRRLFSVDLALFSQSKATEPPILEAYTGRGWWIFCAPNSAAPNAFVGDHEALMQAVAAAHIQIRQQMTS